MSSDFFLFFPEGRLTGLSLLRSFPAPAVFPWSGYDPEIIVEILALVREKDLLQSGIRRNGDPDDIALLLHQLEDSGHGRTGDVEITFQIPLQISCPL